MVGLIHTVAIWRPSAGAVDDYNQPAQTYSLLSTTQALIQPKTGRELAQTNEGGVVTGMYRIFMLPTDVSEGDQIVAESGVYEPTFIADAGGAAHHLEIEAERVAP